MVTFVHLEDDLILQDIFKTGLQSKDNTIKLIQYLRGIQVIEYAEVNDKNVDLYILDIRVRGRIDGLEVAQKLRDSGVKTPIILSSSYERPTKQLLETLNCLWIPKPWSLQQTIEDIIGIAAEYASQEIPEEKRSKTLDIIDLHDLLRTCISHARSTAQSKNIELKLAYREGDDLRTLGNISELYGAFSQLIDNGLRYGKEDGKLIIKLKQSSDKVMLVFEDNGIGIAPEYHEKIFQQFFYIEDDNDTFRTKLTRGEGLYTAKQAILSFGGQLSVYSKLNEGTKFLCTLPALSIQKAIKSKLAPRQ